jgi:hypothetical protein
MISTAGATDMPNLTFRLSADGVEQLKAQLQSLGKDGQRALRDIEQATDGPSAALQGLNVITGEAKEKMSEMSGEAGIVGRVLSAMGPAGIAASVGIGLVTAGITKAIEANEEFERSHRRIQGALQTTGYAAGVTSGQVISFAEHLEKSTLLTKESIIDAASQLTAFTEVTGANFTRVLGIAADLSTRMGDDLPSEIQKLGRVIESFSGGSVDGLAKGFRFLSVAEKEAIADMVKAGDSAGSISLLLDDLQKHVGGAAVGENQGLTGGLHQLGIAWHDMWEEAGKSPEIQKIIYALTLAAQLGKKGLDDTSGGIALSQRAGVENRLADLKAQLAKESETAVGRVTSAIGIGVDPQLEQEIARLQQRLDILKQTEQVEKDKQDREKAAATNGPKNKSDDAKAAALKAEHDTLQGLKADYAELNKLAAMDPRAKAGQEAYNKASDAVFKNIKPGNGISQSDITAEADKFAEAQRRAALAIYDRAEATKKAAEADAKAKDVYASVLAQAEPAMAAEKKYTEAKAALDLIVAKKNLTSEEEARILKDYRATLAGTTEQHDAYIKKLGEENAAKLQAAGLSDLGMKIELEYQKEINAALDKHIALTKEDMAAIHAQVAAVVTAEEAHKKHADEITRIWETARKDIQRDWGNLFDNLLSGQVKGVSGFFNQLVGIERKIIAETLAAGLSTSGAVASKDAQGTQTGSILGGIQPGQSSSLLSNLGQTFGQGPNGFSAQLKDLGSLFKGTGKGIEGALGSLGPALQGSITGSIAGALPGLLGINTSGTGGAIGGAIGSFLPIPGGSIIGGLVGSIVGGLFGKKTPWDSATIVADQYGSTSLSRSEGGSGGSVDNAKSLGGSTNSLIDQLDQLFSTQLKAGSTVGTLGQRDDKYFFTAASNDNGGENAVKYGTADEAQIAALKSAISRDLFEGLSDTVKTVAKNSAAKTVTDFSNDLQFAKAYDEIGKPKISAAATALKQLTDQFDAAEKSARRLGLSVTKVANEEVAQITAMTGDFNANIRTQILGLIDPEKAALEALDKVQQERIDNAKTLGADLTAVERLNGIERQKVLEQYATQATNAFTTSIRTFLTDMTSGSSSPLDKTTVFQNAQNRFGTDLVGSRTGDAASQNDLTGAAKDLLDAGRALYASSTDYYTLFDFVKSSLANAATQDEKRRAADTAAAANIDVAPVVTEIARGSAAADAAAAAAAAAAQAQLDESKKINTNFQRFFALFGYRSIAV